MGVGSGTIDIDTSASHVGGCPYTVEMCIQSIPEMNYHVTDLDENGNPCPRGETCYRGVTVIPGYYKMAEKTKEAIDEEGWLHTGDVGKVLFKN